MESITNGTIVVGVTGSERETAAMRFAAECAKRVGAEVVLAHAFHAVVMPPPPSVLLTYAEAADVAEIIVKGVGEEFEELTHGTVPFRTLTASGPPTRVLTDLSEDARLVVVQHRTSGWLDRLFVGSTSTGVAAHSACPVVSVPYGWQPSSEPGEVVVGVHESGERPEVVRVAFGWAAETGASIRVVHAWHLDPAYDDIITGRVAGEWRQERLEVMAERLAPVIADYPGVRYELEVRHQWPAEALVDATEQASMVVVGRHARHGRPTEHLGSVARTALREARGPIMVVPLTGADGPSDWRLTADEISPQT
jgi:nucleotide-binding universal stress UspA family protein